MHKALYIVSGLMLMLSQAAYSAHDPVAADLYSEHCFACHGTAGRGAPGIPDLADKVWQFGNSPEDIERSITHGRQSTMPALGMALGAGTDETGLNQVVAYVQSLSGAVDADADAAAEDIAAGETLFVMFCASCHGENGRGTAALGAADLTDDIWLYADDADTLRDVINKGRSNEMPAFGSVLTQAEIRALVSYVLRLSGSDEL
jgi:cytochrome c oxidase cbb3-type subunit 3